MGRRLGRVRRQRRRPHTAGESIRARVARPRYGRARLRDHPVAMTTTCGDDRMSARLVAMFAEQVSWDQLPDPVRHRARLALRDSVGVMVAGSVTAAARAAALASEADGEGPVELVATGSRTGRIAGALANAVAASSMDFDDGHVLGGSIHPGGAIVPALLAAGSGSGPTLRQVLEGLIVAYEIAIRAGYL